MQDERSEQACDSDSPANGVDLLTTSAEKGTRKREGTRNSRQAGARGIEKRSALRRERGKTVGLVTRCVLLLLYDGLLHHQNIKCLVGKRACAWVHPHFTFTADCRLNWATFSRFLAPENVLVRPSRILTRPRSPLNAVTGSLLSLLFSILPLSSRPSFNIANFDRYTATCIFLEKFVLCPRITEARSFR